MDGQRAPIDTAVLDAFRKRTRTHTLVERIEAERTAGAISTLVLHFDTDRYPESVSAARLEIQWYENDEYNSTTTSYTTNGGYGNVDGTDILIYTRRTLIFIVRPTPTAMSFPIR